MTVVNMHQAKTNLSRLVEAVESGTEAAITISRNGKAAAMLVPVPAQPRFRLGIANGKYKLPDDFDADNEEIARLFEGEDD